MLLCSEKNMKYYFYCTGKLEHIKLKVEKSGPVEETPDLSLSGRMRFLLMVETAVDFLIYAIVYRQLLTQKISQGSIYLYFEFYK